MFQSLEAPISSSFTVPYREATLALTPRYFSWYAVLGSNPRSLSSAPLTTLSVSHLCLYSISIPLVFTFQDLKWIFRTLNSFRWKSHKLQICCSNRYLQLWFWLFRHPRSFNKFEFQNVKTSARHLRPQMISNEKLINYKVVVLIKIYNFGFGHFFS